MPSLSEVRGPVAKAKPSPTAPTKSRRRSDAEFELVDIKDFKLPLLDEPMPPIMGQYTHDHTKAWSARIASVDAFVFVTPEYNHATSGSGLRNSAPADDPTIT